MTGLGITRADIIDDLQDALPEVIEAIGETVTFTGAPVPNAQAIILDLPSGSTVGAINRQATHEVYLLAVPNFPKRGGFSLALNGVIFLPVGETDDLGKMGVVLRIPLIDRSVFYSDPATVDGQNIQLRIEALTDSPVRVGSGAQDVSFRPNNSHRAYLPPGTSLVEGQQVHVTSTGITYEVVAPIQRDILGDVVGLSWMGDGLW